MTANCCCASQHSSKSDQSTCAVAAAPCAAPLAVLSTNVLDQWIDPVLELNDSIHNLTAEKFSNTRESLLPGITNTPFHPPQYSFS